MSSYPFAPGSGLFVPPASDPNQISDSPLRFPLVPPTNEAAALSLDPAIANPSTDANAIPPGAPASSQPISTVPPTPRAGSSRLRLSHKLSGNFETFKKLGTRIPDFAVFCATMTGLPIIREAIDGVQTMQDWTSNKQKLEDFGRKLKKLLVTIDSHSDDPGYMNPTMVEFQEHLETMLYQVQEESKRQANSHLESARRLIELINEYERQFGVLVEEALVSGVFAQQTVVLPDEYDKTIPNLKLITKSNGLIWKNLEQIRRFEGGSVEQAPVESLHIATHEGSYKDTPVEIREYYGGPDDVLLENVKELVDHHQTFENNSNLPELYGGCVGMRDDKLCAYLVFSPINGEPWLEVARAKKSVELLCQVAEQTLQAFEYLKIRKQMNWESIRIRPDGTLLIVPSTQGENFLIVSVIASLCACDDNALQSEEVYDPLLLPDDDSAWPIKELCILLREADKQGITRDAVEALRAYGGEWDNIAVWKIARDIGLHPPEGVRRFSRYPPRYWQTDPGMIVYWTLTRSQEFYPRRVVRLPEIGLETSTSERAHIRSFAIMTASGKTDTGEFITYDLDHWFKPTADGLWEGLAFDRWQGMQSMTLFYESPRLDVIIWKQWKTILQSAAKRKRLDVNALGITNRTESLVRILKVDVPELGTRPIYFYRKPDQKTASPREFWGFWTFNKDPTQPAGIHLRVCEDGSGRFVSDSLPPDPPGRIAEEVDVDYQVSWVDMSDDWDTKIEYELETRRLVPDAVVPEDRIVWDTDSGDEEMVDDEQTDESGNEE